MADPARLTLYIGSSAKGSNTAPHNLWCRNRMAGSGKPGPVFILPKNQDYSAKLLDCLHA